MRKINSKQTAPQSNQQSGKQQHETMNHETVTSTDGRGRGPKVLKKRNSPKGDVTKKETTSAPKESKGYSLRNGHPTRVDVHLTLEELAYSLCYRYVKPLKQNIGELGPNYLGPQSDFLVFNKKQQKLLREFEGWIGKHYQHFQTIAIKDGSSFAKAWASFLANSSKK